MSVSNFMLKHGLYIYILIFIKTYITQSSAESSSEAIKESNIEDRKVIVYLFFFLILQLHVKASCNSFCICFALKLS